MISRNSGATFTKLLQFYPALVCTGARQTGKTTLLRNLLPQFTYVSLDLPSVAALAEQNPELFFQAYPPPLIIDEIQYAPQLFRHLKAMIDADRHSPVRFVLTGSQKFELMKHLGESLAGRIVLQELEGLSWQECLKAGIYDLETFLLRGGFPELARQPDMPRDSWFASYVGTYLERDVRQLLNVGNLRDFERFIRLLASRNSQQLDMTALGNAIGITGKTVGAWLSVMEASGQISLLQPWFGNVGKRIVKTPKVYFNDTGLVAWLLGVDSSKWINSPFLGSLWESLVYAEIRKTIHAQNLNRTVYYYRDNQGLELDFLVLGGGARLIEAKSHSQASLDDAKNLRRLAVLAQTTQNPELSGAKGYIICRTPNRFSLPAAELPLQACTLADIAELIEN